MSNTQKFVSFAQLPRMSGANRHFKPMFCLECDHGKKTKWVPMLLNGHCPKCHAQRNEFLTIADSAETKKILAEIGQLEARMKNSGARERTKLSDELTLLEDALAKRRRWDEDAYFNKFTFNKANNEKSGRKAQG